MIICCFQFNHGIHQCFRYILSAVVPVGLGYAGLPCAAVNEEVAAQVAARVAELQAELAEARDYAAQQAELRQQAVQEMLNASMGQATAAAMQKFGPYELESAVRAFIGEAGVMAHMGAELAAMRESERADMRRCLDRVQDWVNAARAALGTVVVSVND